ncbi:unnamed protein product [Vicia faba]|uniref:glycerophosphodiester phosphodiesterase n=1 Tax=Vicia faba TaxID=3906 RepID=A0AAV1AUW7_VICFA|nr:unnamed protein product [Vicia faba]
MKFYSVLQTNSSLIEGRWQLIFTTRPGTASPIQRTFVGVDFFSVFQEVYLRTNDPRVCNIVSFSDAIGELKVEAAASIKDGKRILFRFDRAAFSFKFLPFKVPYPVPFKLLGDEAKGWLDTTYLSHSGNLRISRGNKGTTFVLQKQTQPRQKLLTAISSGVRVREAIDELISLNKKSEDKEPELEEGEWQMIWNSQTVTDSWLENAANGLMGKQLPKWSPINRVAYTDRLSARFEREGVKLDNATTIATFDPNEKTYNINGKDVQGHFIGFLTSVNEKVRKKTKFVFQFLNASDVEPTTMQPYGTIVKDLAAIKSYASGIIVPKEYIWPVKPDNYLGPLTTLVSDAHKQGLEVYASSFANDFFSSYDYNYDPTAEYLQFIAKDECVDGLVTDFPSTTSNSIACFALNNTLPKKGQPLIISNNGASGVYLGSTNLAYQQAIDDEADIIDCSVQMTKDGISFCSNTADLMADTTAMTKFMSRTSNVPEIQPNSGIFSFDLKEPGSNIYVKNIDDSVSDEELKSQFVQINKENRKQLPYQITGMVKPSKLLTCFQWGALMVAGRMFHGKPLYVAFAQRKDVRQSLLQLQHSH